MILQPNPQIYNLEEAIRAYGSEAIVKEALRSFLTTSEGLPERLKQSWNERDPAELRKTLHWLKGGLSYLHAPRLKKACLELDGLAHQNPWPDLRSAIDQLNHELAELIDCAHEYLEPPE